jgi:hypothetical protein
VQNGGVIADDCSKCMCPPGYSGLDCGSGVSVAPLAGCAGAAAEIKATWVFGAGIYFTSCTSTISTDILSSRRHGCWTVVAKLGLAGGRNFATTRKSMLELCVCVCVRACVCVCVCMGE